MPAPGAVCSPDRRSQPLRSALAALASAVIAGQSPACTSALGASQEPPTQATLGSARYCAALAASIGLGVVHVVLGLILGAVSAGRHEPRHAIGRGVSAVMVLLVVAALLAAFKVLPTQLFTPSVIALLVAFPVLVLAEGLIAPIELLATLGNVMSYARIMAIGTASVMLAVVANQMVGAVGSTTIGLVFALLFHLVNFAIGLFSPAIHALRLHYVEFFGKFYSPGGRRYEPFGHRTASPGPDLTRKTA